MAQSLDFCLKRKEMESSLLQPGTFPTAAKLPHCLTHTEAAGSMYTPVLIQQECCEFKEAFVDRQGDVYVASGGDEPGVWEVENVLEATSLAGEFEPQTLSVEVEDVPGVLNQVCLHLCL